MNKYEQRMKQLTYFQGKLPPQTPNTLSEAELEKVERELGHLLPLQYREFLRDYGNLLIASFIEIPEPKTDGPSYGAVEIFFGVNSNSSNDLVSCYRNVGEEWPLEFLPISFGDNGYLCLVIAGEEKGAVYFCHCRGDAGGEGRENFYFVAPSFDEFMRLLVPQAEE